MADESVYMDTDFVQSMSADFKTYAENFNQAKNIIQGAIVILQAITLFGVPVMQWAVEILTQFKNLVEAAARKCLSLSADIASARTAFMTGDTDGSKRFVG